VWSRKNNTKGKRCIIILHNPREDNLRRTCRGQGQRVSRTEAKGFKTKEKKTNGSKGKGRGGFASPGGVLGKSGVKIETNERGRKICLNEEGFRGRL